MASTTAKGSGSTVNNGGTFVGSTDDLANSAMTNNMDVNDVNGTGARTGSLVVAKSGGSATAPAPTLETNPDGIQTALGAGTLAYYPTADQRNFIVRGAGSTAAGKINNSATNGGRLTSPAAAPTNHRRIPATMVRTVTPGVRDIKVTAVPNKDRHPEMTLTGGGAVSSFIDPATHATAPVAASTIDPSRNVPGELTYMFGGKLAKQDNYKARDTYES